MSPFLKTQSNYISKTPERNNVQSSSHSWSIVALEEEAEWRDNKHSNSDKRGKSKGQIVPQWSLINSSMTSSLWKILLLQFNIFVKIQKRGQLKVYCIVAKRPKKLELFTCGWFFPESSSIPALTRSLDLVLEFLPSRAWHRAPFCLHSCVHLCDEDCDLTKMWGTSSVVLDFMLHFQIQPERYHGQ